LKKGKPMKISIIHILAIMLLSHAAQAQTIIVPGTSDPWLAGMPDGSIDPAAGGYPASTAPGQSPVLVSGISISPGAAYSFSGSGAVSNDPYKPQSGLDGNINFEIVPHAAGAQNGIAGLTAPNSALIGIFLGPGQPDLGVTPSALDFSSSASRDYLTLYPALQQSFFIGDGLTSQAVIQQVVAPAGATRLYLGTMDGVDWSNNTGAFTVEVEVVPEPGVASLASISLLSLWCCRRRHSKRPA
jgi:hypothetical protein